VGMSWWTYVDGVIAVDVPSSSDAQTLYIAQTVVNHLPRISGSERDVQYYVNLQQGHNCSSTHDEFQQPSNLHDSEYGMFEHQTTAIITLRGSLRDRFFPQTLRETTQMLSRLSSQLDVLSCLVKIAGDDGRKIMFDDPSWIIHRNQPDWVQKKLKI